MLQVAREPDVARETGAYAACSVSTVISFAQVTGWLPSRGSAAARPAVPLVSRIVCVSESNRFARASGD